MNAADPPRNGAARLAALAALFLAAIGSCRAKENEPAAARSPGVKHVLFIAGKKSHGYGSHDHKAGCHLLAKCLNESGLPIEATVREGGWPSDPAAFDGVDAVVMYADGGKGHPVLDHLQELDELAGKGVGIGAIHYAVEVPKDAGGSYFLDWMGGYFETNWSVNPHWTAEFKQLPEHPVTRGVQPFSIKDEWYFHMRFREPMDRVTAILSAVPPSTMKLTNGPHSGNPTVREEVAQGLPQHVCWVVERPDGGRGFGFTGGHFHWNWGHDQFRTLMLNMIAWIAKAEVPTDGVSSGPISVEDLMANHDEPVPPTFKPEHTKQMLDGFNTNPTR